MDSEKYLKSLEEIQAMLVSEIWGCLNKVKSVKSNLDNYNELLGDTSFLLAGLLSSLLKFEEDWKSEKWIDDSLLKKAALEGRNLSISGVMIVGVENTTAQWTYPFYFEMELGQSKGNFVQYTFLFGDVDNPEVIYEYFRDHPGHWESSERNWKYIITRRND